MVKRLFKRKPLFILKLDSGEKCSNLGGKIFGTCSCRKRERVLKRQEIGISILGLLISTCITCCAGRKLIQNEHFGLLSVLALQLASCCNKEAARKSGFALNKKTIKDLFYFNNFIYGLAVFTHLFIINIVGRNK